MSAVYLRLRKSLADLENEARRELTAAAAEGRFDDLMLLTPIAKELADLATRWSNEDLTTGTDDGLVSRRDASAKATGAATLPDGRRSRSRPKKASYPQFLRERNELVKLGWSRRDKEPYEHRVPSTAVDTVVSAVGAAGNAGHRFTVDDIIKSIKEATGSEQIPSYRVYAVVSWLKWAGMVLQHGRQGYTVVRPKTFSSSVETAWQALPQR